MYILLFIKLDFILDFSPTSKDKLKKCDNEIYKETFNKYIEINRKSLKN